MPNLYTNSGLKNDFKLDLAVNNRCKVTFTHYIHSQSTIQIISKVFNQKVVHLN